jgi:hypothetical protein
MMVLFAIGYVGLAVLTYYQAFFPFADATSGLAFVSFPVLGWLSLPLAVIAAAIAIWARERLR